MDIHYMVYKWNEWRVSERATCGLCHHILAILLPLSLTALLFIHSLSSLFSKSVAAEANKRLNKRATMADNGSASPKLESEASPELSAKESQPLKKRKTVQKTVVTVRVGENASKLKNEGLASDSWSWRKYGQKPIKGSPYPRGYYKCSTSKSCSARKQVERCRTDASMFIVTYTSTHNHPPPDRPSNSSLNIPQESQNQAMKDLSETSKVEDQEEKEREKDHKPMAGPDQRENEENFYYLQSPIQCSEDIIVDQEDPFELNPEKTHGRIDLLLDKELPSNSELKNPSTPKSEEQDFFDELEELPISSPFLNLMSRNFSEKRIVVAPS